MMAELRFRDGERVVPDYMEDLMTGLPLHKLTYSQAVAAMNQQNVVKIVDRQMDRVLEGHFQKGRRR
jgi:hypothetical protein